MHLQSFSKGRLLAIFLAGFALSSMLNFYVLPRTQGESSAATLSASTLAVRAEEIAAVGLPVRLRIPSIAVDASIEQMGIAINGVMDTPKGPDDAGWFKLGPRPGEEGSAVIAGHFGWKNDIPAVFDDLHTLKKGDKIYVEDDAGATVTFVVRELRTYTKQGNAGEIFISNDGAAHLNLITCEGIWDSVSKSYSNRLVVFADKE